LRSEHGKQIRQPVNVGRLAGARYNAGLLASNRASTFSGTLLAGKPDLPTTI
jgi:hypothetical protein